MIRRASSEYQRRLRSSSLSADDSFTSPAFGRIRFPRKLYEAANSGSGVIRWSGDGKSIIVSEKTFERQVMSRHRGLVKISSFANFRRQLRCYSFHWRRRKNRDLFEFTHPSFARGHPELLDAMVPGSGDGSVAPTVGRRLARRARGRPRKLHPPPSQSETPAGAGRRKRNRAVNLKLIFQDLYEPGVKEEGGQQSAGENSAEQTQDGVDPLATGSAYICLVPESNVARSQLWPRRSADPCADPWGPTEDWSSDGEDDHHNDNTRQDNSDMWVPDGAPQATVLLGTSLTELIPAAKSVNDYALQGAPRLYLPEDEHLQLPNRDDGYTLTVL